MVPLFRCLVPLLVLLSPPRVSQEIEVTTPVLEPVANATHPAVASDGRDFLLVWKSLATTTFTLTAARLTGDGSLLDPVGFALERETENAAWMAPPEVVWMQGRYFVTSPGMTSIGILAVEDNQVVAERALGAIPTGVEHRGRPTARACSSPGMVAAARSSIAS